MPTHTAGVPCHCLTPRGEGCVCVWTMEGRGVGMHSKYPSLHSPDTCPTQSPGGLHVSHLCVYSHAHSSETTILHHHPHPNCASTRLLPLRGLHPAPRPHSTIFSLTSHSVCVCVRERGITPALIPAFLQSTQTPGQCGLVQVPSTERPH